MPSSSSALRGGSQDGPSSSAAIAGLKDILRREVGLFCQRDARRWKLPIAQTVAELRENRWAAVFFGGTLRSLLLSRLTQNAPGRPRDIDIVVAGVELPALRRQFGGDITRQTRFGGLQLKRVDWQFDVWPLKDTLAFKQDGMPHPHFFDLPRSTFFNLEAVAVEVWPRPGKPRRIFSGDDQFFRGVLERTIEINREENPFVELCVVRAIVMAANLQWKIGPRLLRYLALHGGKMSESDFERVQKSHYGALQWPGSIFQQAIAQAARAAARNPLVPAELSLPKQLTLWPDDEPQNRRIHLSVVSEPQGSAHE